MLYHKRWKYLPTSKFQIVIKKEKPEHTTKPILPWPDLRYPKTWMCLNHKTVMVCVFNWQKGGLLRGKYVVEVVYISKMKTIKKSKNRILWTSPPLPYLKKYVWSKIAMPWKFFARGLFSYSLPCFFTRIFFAPAPPSSTTAVVS